MRRMFRPEREEMSGGWRLHNEELHNMYTSSNISWVIKSVRVRWAGKVARMRSTYSVLVENPDGKRPLGKPRCR
jgi:hypothetical protein